MNINTKINTLLQLAVLCIGLTALTASADTFTFLANGQTKTATVSETEVAVHSADLSSASVPSSASVSVTSGTYWTKIAYTTSTSLANTVASANTLGTDYISPVLKDASGNDVYVNPKIVISFQSGTDETDVESFMDGIEGLTSYSLISSPNQNRPESAPGATTASISYDGFDMYLVSINTTDGYSILDTIESLISNPGEACTIMPDTTVTAKTSTYNDPYYSSEWYANSTAGVDAVTAWNTTTGYSSIKIAVLDTGIANDHPDLTVSDGLNCKPTGDEDEWYPTETYANHGTTVAGVICATGNNSIGIVGVAPNVTVLSINIAFNNTSIGGFNMDPVLVAEGIEWAAAQNCRITNSSWGSSSESFLEPVLEAFANTRISNQMVHFAASGNAGTSSITSPSSANGVISVGATTSGKIKASYSQYGTGLDLVAPGSSIITTDRVGSLGYSTTDYTTNDGTSYASPIAAACAALVLSKNPALTADEVENVLKTTATDLGTSGYDTSYGYGLVKASAALAAVDPYIFFGATNSTGGWKQHAVFGWLCDETFPWYWHAQHGWQYTSSTSADNFIFYDMAADDWFYTTIGENATYPYLYRYGNDTWYYYYTGTSAPRVFYNMTTGQYVNF